VQVDSASSDGTGSLDIEHAGNSLASRASTGDLVGSRTRVWALDRTRHSKSWMRSEGTTVGTTRDRATQCWHAALETSAGGLTISMSGLVWSSGSGPFSLFQLFPNF
jgi:hypothetical protein